MDGNNWFKLETPSSVKDTSQVIRHNDVVRLKHSLTGKYITAFEGVESVSNELANLVSVTKHVMNSRIYMQKTKKCSQFSQFL